jgi:hypothetical protein
MFKFRDFPTIQFTVYVKNVEEKKTSFFAENSFQTEKITLEKVWDSIKAERRQKIRVFFLIVKKSV